MATIDIAATAEVAPTRTERRAERQRRGDGLRRARRMASGALLALVALMSVVAAVVVITLRIGFSPVLSPSMEPVFGPGDLVLTRPIPTSAIAVGQVLVLPIPGADGTTDGDRYVHRVVSVSRDKDGHAVVRTKGDNNPDKDPWTLRIDSPKVPHVIGAVPEVGKVSLLTQGPGLRIALMILVAGCALLGIKRSFFDQ